MSDSELTDENQNTVANPAAAEKPAGGGMFSDEESGVPKSYQVLARKYRPSSFEDLIGQEPMVHTLTNAFASGRVAHAFMLTGVRGVGKTTTARLLARALNYQSDTKDTPQMQLQEIGYHCQAISTSRHMDVMEMDAASHTGVSDIREILDSVRYAPVSARYKIYIIDEVHMLSRSAFNALLKTLEEPPPHAIFILATTEIRKVPITILSRCQRFDLSRVDRETMVQHLQKVCAAEQRAVSEAGLGLLARASEGSVRDALSILDQALVQADQEREVTLEEVRTMLGLADRTRVLDLFSHGLHGEAAKALEEFRQQFNLGADPQVVLGDLLDHAHQITRTKALGEAVDLAEYGAASQQVRELAAQFSMGQLSRAWQILLTASKDVKQAADPAAATEMALIRLCVSCQLPSPEDAAKALSGQHGETGSSKSKERSGKENTPAGAKAGANVPMTSAQAKEQPVSKTATNATTGTASLPVTKTMSVSNRQNTSLDVDLQTRPMGNIASEAATDLQARADELPQSFAELLALIEKKRDLDLLSDLESYVQLVQFQPGAITFNPARDAPADLAASLSRRLQAGTGQRWLVSLDKSANAAPSISEARKLQKSALLKQVRQDPQIMAVMQAFPGSTISKINGKRQMDEEQ